jgi:hypothetical protein
VITQTAQTQLAVAQLTAQIPLHTSQVICAGGDMEGVDHDLGGLIRRQGGQERSPHQPPALVGEQG